MKTEPEKKKKKKAVKTVQEVVIWFQAQTQLIAGYLVVVVYMSVSTFIVMVTCSSEWHLPSYTNMSQPSILAFPICSHLWIPGNSWNCLCSMSLLDGPGWLVFYGGTFDRVCDERFLLCGSGRKM